MELMIDILENEIIDKYPGVLDILLRDHTTQQNILWATDNYKDMGKMYSFMEEIKSEYITGEYGYIIMPRVRKDTELQQLRVREMAEVFTPSWICNAQNNLIDNAWFGRDNVFNKEFTTSEGVNTWLTNSEKTTFPKGKTWRHYIRDTRLEMTCGEAPYLTSRYDTTTGNFIPVEERIGLLDRKLRVINENINISGEWLKATQIAYKSIYGFEWQGDSLLLAREALLITFIENYTLKFGKEPMLKSIKYIAYIISWNLWQMDGLKGVIPNSCGRITTTKTDLFGYETTLSNFCRGCMEDNIKRHNGTYALIKDWNTKDPNTGKKGRIIKFIDLF